MTTTRDNPLDVMADLRETLEPLVCLAQRACVQDFDHFDIGPSDYEPDVDTLRALGHGLLRFRRDFNAAYDEVDRMLVRDQKAGVPVG